MPINIIYRDASILICVKPAGVLSQSDGREDLSALLLKQEQLTFAQPVHRLDREAGGLNAVALNSAAAAGLSRSIEEHAFHKRYCAILKGAPEISGGKLSDLLYHDVRRNKTYPVKRKRKGVKEAELCFHTLAQKNGLTLVSVALLTGRTHQIRVQFSSRGTPLLGDGRYGGGGGTMALWSAGLSFPHPVTGESLHFFLPPPQEEPWDIFTGEYDKLSETGMP